MEEQNNFSGDSIITNILSGNSIFSSNFTEEVWRKEMEHKFRNGVGSHDSIRIFKVPKSLKLQKPEAYIPQNIALGPYHQFDPKLYNMQRCKLHHVHQRYREGDLPEFQLVLDQIKTKATDFRGCYYDYLNMHDDTLSWILFLDGRFLLQLILDGTDLTFDDPLGRTLSIDTIFKDTVMLENQIPFSVLDLLQPDITTLLSKSEFCPKLSPTVLRENASSFPETRPPYHLLDLIYILVCSGGFRSDGKLARKSKGIRLKRRVKLKPKRTRGKKREKPKPKRLRLTKLSQILRALLAFVKHANIAALKTPILIIDSALQMLETLEISISLGGEDEEPLVPTASELAKVKVKFRKTFNGIDSISFKKEDVTLSLPALNLKAKNLEVITMNLLAYESAATPNTPKFARYVELMAAMIRTIEDVKLLKKEEILVGDEDDDDVEIVKLFNGFKNCIKSEGNTEFDWDIEELNEYCENNWRTKAKYLCSWKTFMALATILLLLLMALQTFCSISRCHDIFNSRFASLRVWHLAKLSLYF